VRGCAGVCGGVRGCAGVCGCVRVCTGVCVGVYAFKGGVVTSSKKSLGSKPSGSQKEMSL
jgi:hypothetical protein